MTEMRVLTVRQPWAWAILHAGKDVENRTRNVAGTYRGSIAIHAGLDLSAVASPESALIGRLTGYRPLLFPKNQRGHIVGVVDLVDVHDSATCYQRSIAHAADLFRNDREAFDRLPVTSNVGGLIGRASNCSAWAEDGAHHLVLANPRPLAEPIRFKGALGLRRLDDATRILVESQVAA